MTKIPTRPAPNYAIEDYDDGDPYSCIAAGHAERSREARVLASVEACFGQMEPVELPGEPPINIKTALYDIWHKARWISPSEPLGNWAAQQMAQMGDPRLMEYDSKHGGS